MSRFMLKFPKWVGQLKNMQNYGRKRAILRLLEEAVDFGARYMSEQF